MLLAIYLLFVEVVVDIGLDIFDTRDGLHRILQVAFLFYFHNYYFIFKTWGFGVLGFWGFGV